MTQALKNRNARASRCYLCIYMYLGVKVTNLVSLSYLKLNWFTMLIRFTELLVYRNDQNHKQQNDMASWAFWNIIMLFEVTAKHVLPKKF